MVFSNEIFLLMKLQDLPNEILDYILMKAVVKKVMEKKLAKSAWLEYAVRVIRPLRAVSLQWNFRLTTNWFKIVLSRNIMRKGEPEYSTILSASSNMGLYLSCKCLTIHLNA